MGVRPDEHGVADRDRVVGPAAQQGVLHHDDVGPDPDRTEVAVQDGAVQHARVRPDGDVAGDDGARRDGGGGVDLAHAREASERILPTGGITAGTRSLDATS